MFEIDNPLVKDEAEFTRVLRKLAAEGLSEDEAVKILVRDYWHLFHEPTKADIRQLEERTILQVIASINHERIERGGRPKFVSFQKDGETYHAVYDALSREQIAELRERGIIL